ncbi:hypothetical protein RN001_006879 [Aquatica leii]|uniref:Alpha-1,3/1,6-mannosyltransferase ALG2 n=1 Tax=Aquatica leii TaxID=1421715 RepID=A0AAN7SSC0_9COLE|nr:hypothetical protein RN001_006879 [Aquatica leii]
MEKSRKANVVFIHPDLGIGGAERLVLDVAVALSKEHKNVSFVTNHFNRNHAFQELRDNNFPVSVIGDWLPRSICGICQALCAYFRMVFLALIQVLFVKVKPDVYFVDQIPIAVPFIKWAGGKVIYYCHHPDLLASPLGGSLKRIYRLPINWLELKGTSMADVILVNSKYTASVFHKTFPEITQSIEILYPTIASSYLDMIQNMKPKSIKTLIPELEPLHDPFIFLSINRFHPAKKLELAIEALKMLQNKLSSKDWDRVHLIMAGGFDPHSTTNATYFSKLVKLSESKELSGKITFLKSPSDDLKADLLLACRCLIYTPVNEHFGIVPLEAMTAAKPVIACNSGGPCETIVDDVTGYLCEPTPASFSEGLFKILNNQDLLKMGVLGRERLEQCFSYNMFCTKVNKVVDTVVYGVQSPEPSLPEKIVEEKEDANLTHDSTVKMDKELTNLFESPCSTTYLSTADSSTDICDSDVSNQEETVPILNDHVEVNEESSF